MIPADTFDWRNWHEEIERRNGRLRAENARPAREEREAAEAKEANQVAVGR